MSARVTPSSVNATCVSGVGMLAFFRARVQRSLSLECQALLREFMTV